MLTLSFIHNFAPKKLRRKRGTEKQKRSQEYYPVHLLPGSNFQAKKHPPQKALCAKIPYARLLCTFEIIYKMAASDGKCSISTILREYRAL